MSQLEMEMERLYGDINLTDELVDEDAQILLKWGEAQLERLDSEGYDDATFEEKSHQVRNAMKRINGFIGKRSGYDVEKAKIVLGRLHEGILQIGYNLPDAELEAYIATQAEMDNSAALTALLALIQPEAEKPNLLSGLQNLLGAEDNEQQE